MEAGGAEKLGCPGTGPPSLKGQEAVQVLVTGELPLSPTLSGVPNPSCPNILTVGTR